MIDNDQWRMADDLHWCGADIRRSALLHSTKIVMASDSHRLVANRSTFFFFWAEDKFGFMNFVGVKLLLLEIGDFWESSPLFPKPKSRWLPLLWFQFHLLICLVNIVNTSECGFQFSDLENKHTISVIVFEDS